MLYDYEMATKSQLGERIAAARERLKMSQAQLGNHFEITGSAVSGWERAKDTDEKKNRPDIEKLPLLRKILKVPYAWLLEGDGPPPPPTDPLAGIDDLVLAQKQPAIEPPAKPASKPKRRA